VQFSMNKTSASNALETCKTKNIGLVIFCLCGVPLGSFFLYVPAFAEHSQTTVTPLNDEISLEKTMIIMNVPENNTLPWGTIKGKINNPTQGYPVIIQFFKSLEEDPVHVAQVNVRGDNSFEYRFRVSSTDDGNITNFFEGDYYVKIFKVINTPRDNLDSA